MLPMPPMATAMTTSKDSLKPKLGGAMATKAAPYKEPVMEPKTLPAM